MRRLAHAASVACVSIVALACAPPPGSEELDLAAVVEAAVDRYRVPSASVSRIVAGEVAWTRHFGESVSGEAVYQVASLSKPVTALGVLLLAEEGRIDLDRSVFDYISQWKLPQGEWDSRAVTVRRLLGHSSGLNIHGYPGFPPGEELPDLIASLGGVTAGAGAVRLLDDPGSSIRYSSGGFTVLQLLIEEVTGEAFEDWIRRRILTPADMVGSDFVPVEESRVLSRPGVEVLEGHGWWGSVLPRYGFRARAASGLYSTSGDLARFLTVLWDPGRLGRPADLVEVVSKPAEGGRARFGLGFAIDSLGPRKILLHTGANRGWRSLMAVEPESRDGLVVLTNSDRGLALTTDALCWWGESISGFESASCWADRKSRGTVLLVAGLLALVIAWEGIGIVFRLRAERRFGRRPERYPWLRWARLGFSLAALGLWWLFWYSDTIVVRRDGIENFVPVATVPPTFSWLSLVVTAWCLLGIVRFFLTRPQLEGPVPNRSRA